LEILLSQSSMPIIKYVAWLLGWLMNGIYIVLDAMGIANIGLCIIFFTIILYVALTPIQIKQQKSSKVMTLIQPELMKIQEKYQGKRDQASQEKMSEETMALYRKYGVSPTGSCLPLLIQMLILFGLYQVILYIPGYVSSVKNIFSGLAGSITQVSGYSDTLTQFVSDNSIRLSGSGDFTTDRVIDLLYMLKPSQWTSLKSIFPTLTTQITATAASAEKINSFIGINITETPWDVIKTGFVSIFTGKATGMIVFALIIGILIPVLAWFTQWLNMKLMPQSGNNNPQDQTAQSMRVMNNFMPIFSAFICLTLNMGIGIYWIIGAVVRCVQQVIINRTMKIDPEEMMEKAEEKRQKKEEKRKDYVTNITENARTNVKRIQNSASEGKDIDSSKFYKNAADLDPDSITAKANWVKAYDDRKAAEKEQRRQQHAIERNNRRKNSRRTTDNMSSVEQTESSEQTESAAETENPSETEASAGKIETPEE
jgi:YidC/Oxa1 family membrane protein insertase